MTDNALKYISDKAYDRGFRDGLKYQLTATVIMIVSFTLLGVAIGRALGV